MGEKCMIYNGPCEQVLVDKTYNELSHDFFYSRNLFFEVNGRKYEIDGGLSNAAYLRLKPIDNKDDITIEKKYKLVDHGEPLKLTIINSSQQPK